MTFKNLFLRLIKKVHSSAMSCADIILKGKLYSNLYEKCTKVTSYYSIRSTWNVVLPLTQEISC
jgi:hypothetical protein